MENKRVTAWLEDSKRWLALATSAKEQGFYDKSLYCLEMSFESSIKAALTRSGIEFPKSHNIAHLLMLNKDKLPDWLRDDQERVIDIFTALLESRNASSYRAESSFTDQDFKKKVDRYFNDVEDIEKNIEKSFD